MEHGGVRTGYIGHMGEWMAMDSHGKLRLTCQCSHAEYETAVTVVVAM